MIFQDNPYFSAGFGLLGVGAGLAVLRRGATQVAGLIRRRMICTMEITSRDPLFHQVLSLLERHNVNNLGSHFLAMSDAKKSQLATTLLPGQGTHYFKFNRRLLKMERNRERAPIEMAAPFETITLSWLDRFPRSDAKAVAGSLLEQARIASWESEKGKLLIYTSFAHEWRVFGNPRRKRPLESVVLPSGQLEGVLNDIGTFLGNSKWYYERGIPYRRGYLLHGPPGGGKSSLIQALASHLDYGICMMSLAGDSVMTDDRLQHLMHALPDRCMLLLEDIDAAVSLNRDSTSSNSRLTLSGLLNAIDGVAAAEERIIFMTTNHPEKLDPALIRPGRIDYAMQLGLATPEQAQRMFLRFFNDSILANQFGELYTQQQSLQSPAELQGIFISNRDDAQGPLRRLLKEGKEGSRKISLKSNEPFGAADR